MGADKVSVGVAAPHAAHEDQGPVKGAVVGAGTTPHSGHAYPFSEHPGQTCPHQPSCTPTSVTREPPVSHVWSTVLSPSASLLCHPAATGRDEQRGPSLQGPELIGPSLPTHPPSGKFTACKTQSSPFGRWSVRGTEKKRGPTMGCPDAVPLTPLIGQLPAACVCSWPHLSNGGITTSLRVSRSI